MKTKVPHAYLRQDSDSIGKRDAGKGFPKEKRFAIVAMKTKHKVDEPSPSQYNSHMYNTISSNFGLAGARKTNSETRLSLQDKYHNKQYYKELER